MKFLFDFFPILLFFVAYKWGDIYLATAVAIIASIIQVLYSRYQQGRFATLPLVTLATITLLGSATLFFRNELFIKWKPTVVYGILSLGFLLSHWIGEKTFIQRLAEKSIALPSKSWNRLNLSWVLFFASMGITNLYVVYHFDTDTWVNFKLFGTLGLTLVFVIAQGVYMARHHQQSTPANEQ